MNFPPRDANAKSPVGFGCCCHGLHGEHPLHGEEPAASIGKRLAADSGVRWTVHDTRHPLLGSIKFAVQEKDVATTVGKEKIFSLSYVSCQKTPEKVAIELTNAPASAPAGGLGPRGPAAPGVQQPRAPRAAW